MITLGIETSCDETALALLETRENNGTVECRVISSLIHSQADLHSAYGGVFPTLAKREHSKNLLPLLKKILFDSKELLYEENASISVDQFENKISTIKSDLEIRNTDLASSFVDTDFLKNIPIIDKIAVTEGPGLEPALWVGISFAKVLSELWSIPIIPINHMEGHVLGSLLDPEIKNGEWQKLKELNFPAVALLISGGHTELIKITRDKQAFPLKYEIIGQTKDDAVGEAFDKTARLLGLPYPGGPHISKLANEAEKENIKLDIKLPRPMIDSKDLDFSFSGLKTAVLYAVRNQEKDKGSLDNNFKKGLAREFEESVNETLVKKLRKSIELVGARTIIVGGGVIANTRLRNSFEDLAKEYALPIYLPSKHVSGDNALMIALAGALGAEDYKGEINAQGTKKLGI
jgi:N6-L-threonylcarbamoyladenine synthase